MCLLRKHIKFYQNCNSQISELPWEIKTQSREQQLKLSVKTTMFSYPISEEASNRIDIALTQREISRRKVVW